MNTITYAGHSAGTHPRHSLRKRIAILFAHIGRARKARHDFEALRSANDHLLADIGMTRSQLESALDAPFWVDPSVRIKSARKTRGY